MKRWIWIGLGLALATTPAAAREACTARPPAQVIAVPSSNMQRDLITLISLGPSVTDKTVQRKALLKARAECDDGGFEAGGQNYAVFETRGPSLKVVARATADAPILYVASFPDITDLVTAELEKRPAPTAATRYVLVISTTSGAAALRVYDAIPDGETLRADMAAALKGRFPPLVSIDKASKQLQVNVQADAYKGPESMPGARPPPGTGLGPPVVSAQPQNDSFQNQPDGGALHPPTGFTCPASLDGFARKRLIVYDAAEGGRDVSCGYESPQATATLYLTRLPGQFTLEKVFATYVEQAKSHTPLAADAPDPYPVSDGGPRRLGRFWRDKEGRGEGLWLIQRGSWFVKLRVTYAAGDVTAIRAFATDLLAAVDAQIKPPTI